MAARTGEQFLDGLRHTKRRLHLEGERVVVLHEANDLDAAERAALFRLAWDFVGSGLGARNALYERFYLTSAARNRIDHHMRHTDRSRAYELVDSILTASR